MIPYYSSNSADSDIRRCPYCGNYIRYDTTGCYSSSYTSYTIETPGIEYQEKPKFNFINKIGRYVEKKVLHNVWKPIRA